MEIIELLKYGLPNFLKYSEVLVNSNSHILNLGINKSNKDNKEFLEKNNISENDIINNQIIKFIKTEIYKIIYNQIRNGNYHLIDLTKVYLYDFLRKLESEIPNEYKNIVTNMKLCSDIGDSSMFTFGSIQAGLRTPDIHQKGILKGVNVYVDPYLHYTCEEIFYFNDINYNISDFNFIEDDKIVEVHFKLNLDDFKHLMGYITTSEHNKSLELIKIKNRDKKIDDILK